jgi:hypothetical protein
VVLLAAGSCPVSIVGWGVLAVAIAVALTIMLLEIG